MAVDWSNTAEHIARHNITPAQADEALADLNRIVFEPDYNSNTGESVRTIGFSRSANHVLTVITVEEDGVVYGATAFKSNTRDLHYYRRGGPDG